MFVPFFCRHAALIKRAFQEASPDELMQLEELLKKIGKRAESLAQKRPPLVSWRVTFPRDLSIESRPAGEPFC